MVLHLFAGLLGKRETGFGTEHKYHHRCPQITDSVQGPLYYRVHVVGAQVEAELPVGIASAAF